MSLRRCQSMCPCIFSLTSLEIAFPHPYSKRPSHRMVSYEISTWHRCVMMRWTTCIPLSAVVTRKRSMGQWRRLNWLALIVQSLGRHRDQCVRLAECQLVPRRGQAVYLLPQLLLLLHRLSHLLSRPHHLLGRPNSGQLPRFLYLPHRVRPRRTPSLHRLAAVRRTKVPESPSGVAHCGEASLGQAEPPASVQFGPVWQLQPTAVARVRKSLGRPRRCCRMMRRLTVSP
mmetsp:Transcript_5094/g.7306  ORF Transcript_5094/g.7306 Transcript_5094/m.7306 type:complete len:229 (-) Transcript_5094:947-1633(-)